MNIKLFAAAALVVGAMSAAPAFAADGYLDANYVNITSHGNSTSAYQLDGSYNTAPKVGEWGAEVDGSWLDANDTDGHYDSAQITFFKRGENHLLGFYANYTDDFKSTAWEGGGLGQLFGSKYTLSGLVGYGVVDGVPQPNYVILGANGTYYPADNLAIGLTAGYTDVTSNGSGNVTMVGAQAEWKPSSTPFSFVLADTYEHPNGSNGADGNLVSVGVRWNFGGAKTLKERDQGGVISAIAQRFRF
jgi:hypothetical protein